MPEDSSSPSQIAKRQRDDDALLADLNAAPSLEEARESYEYWRNRLSQLPRHRRAERAEATDMAERWKQRLAAAERERYGPSPMEQLLELLGVRWRPNPRRLLIGAGLLSVLLVAIVVALMVVLVVFWPELQPIVRTLIGNGGDGG